MKKKLKKGIALSLAAAMVCGTPIVASADSTALSSGKILTSGTNDKGETWWLNNRYSKGRASVLSAGEGVTWYFKTDTDLSLIFEGYANIGDTNKFIDINLNDGNIWGDCRSSSTVNTERNITAGTYLQVDVERDNSTGLNFVVKDLGTDGTDNGTVVWDVTVALACDSSADLTIYPYYNFNAILYYADSLTDLKEMVADDASIDTVDVTQDLDVNDMVYPAAFYREFSDYYRLSGDFTATFDITVGESCGGLNYDAPYLFVTTDAERGADGYTEYLTLRSDSYGWGTLYDTGFDNTMTTADANNGAAALSSWTGFTDVLNGSNIEYTVSRAGDLVTVIEKITTADGTTSYDQWIQRTITDDTFRVFFSTEQCDYRINSVSYSAESDITTYRGSTYTAPTKSGYIFAGWYSDSNYETPIASTTTTGTAYPKFVSDSLLTVKGQLAAATTAESDTTSLRVFTAVDSLNYQKVTLDISYTLAGTDTAKNKSVTLTTAYASVKSWTGTADEVLSAASVFGSSDAAYLLPLKLTNIKNADFNTDFTFTPSYVTTDGTIVTGSARTIKISEVLAA